MTARRRRLLLLGTFLVVVIAVALLARRGPTDPEIAATSTVDGYRIVYRVEVLLEGDEEVTERELVVRRPFDAWERVLDGEGRLVSGLVAGERRLTLRPEGALDHGERLPEVPEVDYRLGAILPDLVERGLAEPGAATTVAGRPCRRFRFGAPLGDPLRPVTAAEHADLCIDDDGLVLEEEWTLGGRVIRRTTAVEVDSSVPAVPAWAETEAGPHPGESRSVTVLDPDEVPPVPFWVVTDPPGGFRLGQRSRATTTALIEGVPRLIDLVHSDAYVRGPDAIVVAHRDPVLGVEGAHGEEIDGGDLGPGRLTLTPTGPQATFATDEATVTVTGTSSMADLLAFVRHLRRAEGTPPS